MSQHTPAPWGLETVITSCGICHKIGPFPYKLNEKPVAACVYVDYPGNGDIERELKANAVLMQSAPDLLQAASDAYARLLSLGQYDSRHTLQGQSELAALVHAIAKATGRASQDVQDEFEAREVMRVPE